jgi:hypothetical protein
MAAWPVVLRMYVDDRNYAKKIKKVVKKLRGTYPRKKKKKTAWYVRFVYYLEQDHRYVDGSI